MTTLEELIDQQINLGYKDPHDFPELLKRALGDELITIVAPYIDDFIAEVGRHRLNSLRRKDVARITRGGLGDPQIMLRSMWVPSGDGTIVYKPIGEMTADDFDSRAVYLEHMANGIRASAQWCRDVADMMRAKNARTAKDLKSLPALREVDV